ncbi:hypothetical protein C8Q78DRAFT_978224 [Trametes maxima]|nr:hypothetical protein C8Q78DRAFT_978224 [Trametes maxima]
MHTRFLELPTELLLLVGEYTPAAGLASLALVNRSMNEPINSALYSSIELKGLRSALLCLRTLSLPPSSLARGRDLAGLVKALHLTFGIVVDNITSGHSSGWNLEKAFAKVATRLTSLRSFSYKVPGSLRFNTLIDLLTASSRVLFSFDIILSDENMFSADFKLQNPFPSPAFERLVCVGISNLWDLPAGCFEYLHQLLVTRADHLQVISLCDAEDELSRRLLDSTTFPALRELCLETSTFLLSDFPHAAFPNLLSLTLYGLEDFDPDQLVHSSTSISTAAYPVLRSLACDVSLLPTFLPKDTDMTARRPIHTVQLNCASYERNGGGHSIIAPEWEEVSAALSHLPFSGVPVCHLAFNAYRLSLDNLSRLLPSLKDLESLVMVIVYEPEFRSNAAIRSLSDTLEDMPHLHTLLFSDAPMKTEDYEYCFTISFAVDRQRDIIRQWSERTTSLRRVAFTTEKEWVRRGDEWVLITD